MHTASPTNLGSNNTVTLCLTGHTNVGKTALARSLLRRDVGVVKNKANVTSKKEQHVMLNHAGFELRLVDLPGFTDVDKLIDRLRQPDGLIHFFKDVWNRVAHHSFFLNQAVLMDARDHADVVLYVVDATDDPGAAGFLMKECEILELLGKPVIVLVNKSSSGDAKEQSNAVAQWEQYMNEQRPALKARVGFADAFYLYWKHEERLLDLIEEQLPANKKGAFASLKAEWNKLNQDKFEQSMQILGKTLAEIACKGVVCDIGFISFLRESKSFREDKAEKIRKELGGHFTEEMRNALEKIVELHKTKGQPDKPSSPDFKLPTVLEPELTGVITAILACLGGGMLADILAGGMTFGGGAISGAFVGGVSGYLYAKLGMQEGCDNLIHWSPDAFRQQVKFALLSYLAIAHYGAGRQAGPLRKEPDSWGSEMEKILNAEAKELRKLIKDGCRRSADKQQVQDDAIKLMLKLGRQVTKAVYP